ncbi:SGNH/GDSL hydrolase family protein [Actinokineospora guangxiensis]|uniref:SGNH/GDSL hydrolase family protein n=1 Tax=Actinokineospora guangxiensis TaxID=1490288 RepID=A0ABW0EQI8_9PSEU
MSYRRRLTVLLLGVLLLLSGLSVTGASARSKPTWVGTWASVPTATPASGTRTVTDVTVRQVVHASAGGDQVRLRLTNEFGSTPLRVGEVRVALRAGTGTDIDPRTDRAVRFGGQRSVTVAAGAPIISDAVPLRVPAYADLVVSIHLPERTTVSTVHGFAYQRNALAAGNVTGDRSVTPAETLTQWWFLSGVSVLSPQPRGAVVALGDSITNGAESTVGANRRYPDLLAQRLRRTGVLNLGVAGNRLLHDPNPPVGHPAESYAAYFGQSALRRFDRDVLGQPGVEHVIVLLGVNDLGHPGTSAPVSETVSAEEIIAAHHQLITRAHQAGLKIHGGTILPFKGDTLGFWSQENESKRAEVNHWIRTSAPYDSVIDFDTALRDPADPLRLHPRYDSGDHLHPNDAGMAALAATVPTHAFR